VAKKEHSTIAELITMHMLEHASTHVFPQELHIYRGVKF